MLLGPAQGADVVTGCAVERAACITPEVEHEADLSLVRDKHELVLGPRSKQLSSGLGGGAGTVCTNMPTPGTDEAQGTRGVAPCAFRKGSVRTPMMSVARIRTIPCR